MSIHDIYFADRQIEILWLLWNEPHLTHAEIAERLGLAKATIEVHFGLMYKILRQYGVKNDLSLMITLVKAGWFDEQPKSQAVKING